MKVLLITSKKVGDTLFYTPAFAQLHQHQPDVHIDILAMSPMSAEVLAYNPTIEKIILAEEAPLEKIFQNYDRVISMHDSADIREYVGSHKVEFAQRRPSISWADYACQFLARSFDYPYEATGSYLLYPQQQHFDEIKKLLAERGVTAQDLLIGLHMGNFRMMRYGDDFWKKIFRWKLSGKGSKSWSFERCVKVVEQLHKKFPHLKVILTGAPSEKFLAKHFSGKGYVIDLIGQTNILQLAALMTYFKTYLTGDTGPLHVACAMNTPLVALFGKTNPKDTGPHPKAAHRVVIYQPAMDKITVDEVEQAVSRFLV